MKNNLTLAVLFLAGTVGLLLSRAPLAFANEPPELRMLAHSVERVYAAEIQRTQSARLKIILDRDNPLYFGGSTLEGGVFEIRLGARLLKLKGMNSDAALFLMCHEMGHLLGGTPKKPGSDWSSTEAQSDYFAASQCFRKVSAPFSPSSQSQSTMGEIQALCTRRFSSKDDSEVCQRTLAAGRDLIDSIYQFMNVPEMKRPDLQAPAETLTKEDLSSYPSLQCRLDTIAAGAQGLPRPFCNEPRVSFVKIPDLPAS